MSLEEFNLEIESWESSDSLESSREISEKFKKSLKKTFTWIKRTRNDEKKAKKHDFLLASFLVKIILDKKYDFLLASLFKALDNGYPSSFVLWILSLIDIEISDKIREVSFKKKINFTYSPSKNVLDFHDYNLDNKLKDRINFWVEDIVDAISIDYSSVLTENFLLVIENKSEIILDFISLVFKFFFNNLNVNITKNKSYDYSCFILSEIKNSLKSLDIEKI